MLMSEGRLRSEWDRFGPIILILANATRDPKNRPRPYRLEDIHPFVARDKVKTPRPKPLMKVPISALKDVFINRQMPKGVEDVT